MLNISEKDEELCTKIENLKGKTLYFLQDNRIRSTNCVGVFIETAFNSLNDLNVKIIKLNFIVNNIDYEGEPPEESMGFRDKQHIKHYYIEHYSLNSKYFLSKEELAKYIIK